MIEISGNQKARGLVNMVDEIEHLNRAPTTFVELSEAHMRPRIILMKHDDFRFAISGRFCSIAVFNSSNWEQYFSEFIVSLFGKSS